MFSYFSISIGIITLVISLIMIKKMRHNTRKGILFITVGIFISTFFFILPTFNTIGQGAESFTQLLHNVVASLLYSFDTLSGGQDIDQITNLQIDSVSKFIYLLVNYISFILAPILASSLIISFIGDLGNRIRYFFNFSNTCYCFSELTENTLIQAQTINKKKKKVILFCNCKDISEILKESAIKSGFLLLNKKCSDFRINNKHKHFEFYLTNKNEFENIKVIERIVSENDNSPKTTITLNVFVKNETNIPIIESIINKQDNNISVHFVNETKTLCYELLHKNPVYAYPSQENSQLLSVLLIGCGTFGMQMLKTLIWYTQIIGFSVEINVIDKDADAVKNKFEIICPEITNNNYNINFIEADVEEISFFSKIHSISFPGYVIVATRNDECNFNTAIQLQAELKRTNSNYEVPPVFVRLRTELYSKNLFKENDYLKNRNIHPFGSLEEVYSNNILFNTYLEKMALAVHLSYSNKLDKTTDSDAYQYELRQFRKNEYSRRSSMVTALHIFPKLYSCGIISSIQTQISDEDADRFEKLILSDESLLEELAVNEHSRWMAFMRSEGYKYASPEELQQTIIDKQKGKDDITKQHICITEWENLDIITEKFNKLVEDERKTDFKKTDIDMVKSIPQIVKHANRLMKE